ncbi:hypothetical protein Slin14017_G012370 [Septoria linicola]|nr:hypothetical protein Slin14017_G012370 [Septoria linicola]
MASGEDVTMTDEGLKKCDACEDFVTSVSRTWSYLNSKKALLGKSFWDNARLSATKDPLEARDYIDVMGEDFVNAYEKKVIEYRTNASDRVYCPHSVLVSESSAEGGSARALDQAELEAITKQGTSATRKCQAYIGDKQELDVHTPCPECKGLVCTNCGDSVCEPASSHECSAPKPDGLEEYFASKTLGVDYQRCPGCSQPYEHKEACNHFLCSDGTCRTGFCFLCGQAATHDSDHWTVGNPTGCTKWGRPGESTARFDAAPAPDEERRKAAVLDVPPFKECYIEAWKQELGDRPLRRWLFDPLITEQWIIVCGFLTGPRRMPFDSAELMLTDIREGQELTMEGYDAFQIATWAINARPAVLRQTLVIANGKGLITVILDRDDDDVARIQNPDRESFVNKGNAARKNTPDWRSPNHGYCNFRTFLRAMEHVLRARGTSVGEAVPLNQVNIILRHVWEWNNHNPHTFSNDDTATFCYLLSDSSDRAILDEFESILFNDPELFNACLLEKEETLRRNEEGPDYEKSIQHVAFTMEALMQAMTYHREDMRQQLIARVLFTDSLIEYRNFGRYEDWFSDVPENAIIVVESVRPELTGVLVTDARICGFDERNGELQEFHTLLRKVMWFYDGSERAKLPDAELRSCMIGFLARKKLLMPFHPEQSTTYVSRETLFKFDDRTETSRNELRQLEGNCLEQVKPNDSRWLRARQTRTQLFKFRYWAAVASSSGDYTDSDEAYKSCLAEQLAYFRAEEESLKKLMSELVDEIAEEVSREDGLWAKLFELDVELK